MKITITADLSLDEANILAGQKWYSSKISVLSSDPKDTSTFVEIDNPQSSSDFIRQVYESIIINDATKIFTEYRSTQLKEQQRLLEEAVRESVTLSITSIVE